MLVALSALPPSARLYAQSYDALFLPVPDFVGLGAKSDPLSVRDLETASLLASGVKSEGVTAYMARIDAYLAELATAMGPTTDPAARAEGALTFLHKRIMRAYRADATTIDGILDTGLYNCVSSAVLYMIAAQSLGLDVQGVQTSDHAFCVVHLPGRDVDVETTNPEGYDPGTKRAFTDSFGRVTGFAYVPPGDYSRRRTIGGKALIGLILSNRVVLAEGAGNYSASIGLGVDYDELERDAPARSFLVDRVNNLAADLVQRGDYAGAGRLAAAARAALGDERRLVELAQKAAYMGAAALAQSERWPEALDEAERARAEGLGTPELSSLIAAALNNEVVALAQKGDFPEARRVIEARSSLAGPELAASLSEKVGESELALAIQSLPFKDALAAAERELSSGAVSRPAWERATDVIYLNEANRVARTGDWLGASAIAAQGADVAPGDGSLAAAARSYKANFVALSHNAFAELYNSRRFAQARDSVNAALARLPGDPTLLQDLGLANKALGQ